MAAALAVPMAAADATKKPLERCDTICSSNTCVLQKRKPVHPLAMSFRNSVGGRSTAVSQRILSAKKLRMKTVQNQLNDANHHLAELINENKILRNLQKRQDNALSKYEGAKAELPKILQSHQEEIRILETKNKSMRKLLREVSDQLKIKDEELAQLKEHYKHLQQLSKDKHLIDREKLSEKVGELTDKLLQYESTISLLNRKMMLEGKNYRYKLNAETGKNKTLQKDLSQALLEIERLASMLDLQSKDSCSLNGRKQLQQQQQQQQRFSSQQSSRKIMSLISLKCDSSSPKQQSADSIQLPDNSLNVVQVLNDGEATGREVETPEKQFQVARKKSSAAKKQQQQQQHLKEDETDGFDATETRLKAIVQSWNVAKQKTALPAAESVDEQLGNYCSQIISSVENCHLAVEKHRENFVIAKTENASLLEALRENDALDAKLRKSAAVEKRYYYEQLEEKNIHEDDAGDEDINRNIIAKEMKKRLLLKSAQKKKEPVEPVVQQEDKKKLLAALKAIDDGHSVDMLGSSADQRTRSKVMEELFGHIDK